MRTTIVCAGLLLVCFLTGCVTGDTGPGVYTDPAARGALSIVNLEAIPVRFAPGQPVDFLIRVDSSASTMYGVDVGVYHGGRVVGWEVNKTLYGGENIFRLRDASFTGEAGAYIVRARYGGRIIAERVFATRLTADRKYTIDPGDVLADEPVPEAVVIVNLEASPVRFSPGQPIQFVLVINKTGPALQQVDVGVFHEGRLVGWEKNKVLNPGPNVFRLQYEGFSGDPGGYIVSVKHRGRTIAERRFGTRTTPDGKYTIDPR